jgi:TRAP-type C4-dicarboxylate transport system substrate-binding protein
VPSNDQLRAVSSGIADVTCILSGFWPADIPLSNVAWLPGVTTDSWSGMMALRDLIKTHPGFKQELEGKNKIKFVTGSAVGPTGIITTRPVRTLDDLKGMKIISIAGPLSDWLKALGAVAVFIPAPERYDALSRKTVDGFTGQPINISVFRYHEPAKYFIDSFLGSGSHYLAMNLSSWNKLPQDLKKVIEETETFGITEAARRFQYEGYSQKINEVMKPAGVQFTDASPADVVKAKKVAREVVWEKWIRENEAKKLPARQIFNDFIRLYKKYEAESPFKGQFPPSVLD